ncbi:DUF2306 domain-containing protein [Nitratireductor sp. XY-223]|uniref:DUF2306 domain-containing protein n=1 Tax=Nitratireductor sp. XY-223 TaxID=2561926 RepID=UPI0010AA08E6|nr:DUF2306 domain-containing protein [Nitratireductor sp. XY-223]
MTAGGILAKFVPTIASERRWIRTLNWMFLFGAAFVVVGIFVLSAAPFEAYLDGASATDRALTHRLRNNADRAGIFFIHIYTGTTALALGTLQIYKPLRSAHPNLHRWLGRLYVVLVMISAGASLWLSPRLSVFGTEFIRQLGAVLWATFTILGVIAIRNSDVASHRRWMARSYAFAYMGITFLFLSAIRKLSGMPLEYGYPMVVHLSFLLNLAVCELILRRSKFQASKPGVSDPRGLNTTGLEATRGS